jgi:hypothetical protein
MESRHLIAATHRRKPRIDQLGQASRYVDSVRAQQYTDPRGAVVVLNPVMRRVLVVTRRCGRDPRLCEGDNIGTGWIELGQF